MKIPFKTFTCFYLSISALLRLTLWILYGISAKVHWEHVPGMLLFGMAQDLIACLFFMLPLSLVQMLPERVVYSVFLRRAYAGLTFAAIFSVIFLFPAEILFFDEFSSRFNLVAVDYFAYPTEVFGNIWESYPIVWCVVGITAVSALVFRKLWSRLQFYRERRPSKNRLFQGLLHSSACALFLVIGSNDMFAHETNRVQTQITRNGLLSFIEAALSNNIEYDHYYAQLDDTKAYDLMRRILAEKGGALASSQPEDLTRRFDAREDGLGRMNVVIIGEESLGAQFIGALGDTRNLSPNFDRLSKEGLLFENAYATGTRTVRGLEAISMSLPPIPSESTLKRPGNEHMANLGQVLNQHGYHSSFIYGGFSLFDNMGYFFSNNGFDISDRRDVDHVTFSNIWGICDEDLLNHAISYFDRETEQQRPFFSIVMTTSNHKPFTFPSGIPGIVPSGGGREMGVKYADYALGKFFDAAKKKSWYNNTIFVVIGDHDSRVYGRAHIPVERFRVALMLLAPGHLAPRRVPNVISQIDIAPTIMGLLGLPYEAPFYGRDMLAANAPLSQPVLVNHNYDVGYYENGVLAVTGMNSTQNTFRYTEDNKTIPIELNHQMQEELSAYLQTAYQLYRDKRYILPKNIKN